MTPIPIWYGQVFRKSTDQNFNFKLKTNFLESLISAKGHMKIVHLARRGDVDEGGVLVVVVLVRGCVWTLRRGEGLGNTWRKIEIYMNMHNKLEK